ncbi:amino acid ABC transporter permease [Leptolinea tardivitalis]|uniref:Amino acid ABC transporter permease n=1 Tax=Leptolinea tardivitalis TaxID=229920 RepID=A0A0P6XIJ1_9CHLR|nr:amino acid ABC transporter permease [Leptolinea tardivitalis]KPL74780.1 amino acid ABC transporter permease [Leptolinea tardivitalis]GAP22846.1 amino acid ABC transporter membrane protein, PAAT family [Leptolinea tardivitalis]
MEIQTDGAVSITPIPSPKNGDEKRRFDKWWLLLLFVVFLIAYLSITKSDPYWRIILFVRDGIWVSLSTTVISFLLVLVVGLLVGLGRLSKSKVINGISTVYVEVIRGIPLLVQLLFWYFAFPSVVQAIGNSLNIEALKNYLANPVGMAILGLTFCYAAYMAEIYRAGIQSIPKGQMEAARSLGMSHFESMRYVILPQAVRIILPPVGNEFISLLKDSSLVSVVAVADITRRGREFMAANFIPLETWTMVALLYLTMTLFSARIVTFIEHKTRLER